MIDKTPPWEKTSEQHEHCQKNGEEFVLTGMASRRGVTVNDTTINWYWNRAGH